jgi:hypothetical protein
MEIRIHLKNLIGGMKCFSANPRSDTPIQPMKLEKGEVISMSTFVMSVRRAGVLIEIRSMESTREMLSGEIISFSGKMEMAGVPVTKNGWVQGNEIVIKEKQFFRENETRHPLRPGRKNDMGVNESIERK